jgi:hypothetical protein
VLRRGLRSEVGEDLRYYLDMSHNDFQSVGTERKIRVRNLKGGHESTLVQKVAEMESGFSALQWTAAAALAQWTADRAYTPIRDIDEARESEDVYPGLGFEVAAALAEEMKRSAKASPDAAALPLPVSDLQRMLQKRIEAFTIPILRSLDDVDASEVSKAATAAEFRATDKRRIDPDKFTDPELMALLGGSPKAPAPPAAPAQAQVSFYVAVDGQTQGPFDYPALAAMRREGRLEKSTLVYDAAGGTAWVPAGGEQPLAPLFAPEPPPAPVRPPPPPMA